MLLRVCSLLWSSWRPALCATLVAAFILGTPAALRAAPDDYGLGNGSVPYVAPSAGSIINSYAALAGDVARGASVIDVLTPGGFNAGDLVLIIQVQRGSFESGDATPVTLASNAAGAYELARITSISGARFALDHALTQGFLARGSQVVRVREFSSVLVAAGRSITAPAWNGATGGIVAFLATGSVVVLGSIDVDGKGFRGGAVSDNRCAGACDCAFAGDARLDAACSEGLARRGEGADEWASGSCGTGNRANAGGGGGLINAGGAGGGNGGFGGGGGNAWCSNARAGGYGGGRFIGSLETGLTFGGGGGGGQQNTGAGARGGAGGGAIWVRARRLIATGTLHADGEDAPVAVNDGGGGGGAGGSILVRVTGAASCGGLRAEGGAGTSVAANGGGGGGGGGRVWLEAPSGNCAGNISVAPGGAGSGHSYPDTWNGGGTPGTNQGCDRDFDGCSECGGESPSNDGIDSDGDGICDLGDADDDADGVPDVEDEAPRDPCVPFDDASGCVDGDADGDGIPNGVECPNPTACRNTDGADVPDYLDLDSDNDGLPDAVECTQSPCESSDNDGMPDYADADSDGDGDGDRTDCARRNPAIRHGASEVIADGIDQNCDGQELCYDDDDNDGYLDASGDTRGSADLDCADANEASGADPHGDCNDVNPALHPGASELCDALDQDCDGSLVEQFANFDGDALPDCVDPDDDADSDPDVSDCSDLDPTIHAGAADADCDGVDENCNGLRDEAAPASDPACTGKDADGDGLPNGLECPVASACPDSDRDGLPDFGDLDSDADGLPDAEECSDPGDCDDQDDDALPDYLEHRDRDSDGDGEADDADGDSDDDGTDDGEECDGPSCADTDGDSIPDALDADDDGPGPGDSDRDGASDAEECAAFPCEDTDADDVPDYADRDSDDDGVPDATDPNPRDRCVPFGCDGHPDAGGGSDAGEDAGVDGSMPPGDDAGSAADAGTDGGVGDAGDAEPDAGSGEVVPDAGMRDAGASLPGEDAGVVMTPGEDAGESTCADLACGSDAGGTPPTASLTGGACAVGGGARASGELWLLALLALGTRRWRRRQRS